MGALLDKFIDIRVNTVVDRYKSSGEHSENDLNEVKKALADQWRSEIKKEIIEECSEEEKQQIKAAVDKEREQYSAKKAIEDLRSLVIEGIFLAIIVGLLVNQVTDIISYIKGQTAYIVTFILIAALVLTLFVYVLSRLASTIGKLLKK